MYSPHLWPGGETDDLERVESQVDTIDCFDINAKDQYGRTLLALRPQVATCP
jgi:hypothetical protein